MHLYSTKISTKYNVNVFLFKNRIPVHYSETEKQIMCVCVRSEFERSISVCVVFVSVGSTWCVDSIVVCLVSVYL